MVTNSSPYHAAPDPEAEAGEAALPALLATREKRVRRDFWDKLTRFAGRIPFAHDAVAAYFCAMDPNTPIRVRTTLLAALVYFIVPIDAIPDMFAGLGFTDDAAVLAAAMALVSSHIKPRHRQAAASALDQGATPPGDD